MYTVVRLSTICERLDPSLNEANEFMYNLASDFTLPQYLVELFKRATKDIAKKAIETKMLRVEVQHVFAHGIIS